MNKLIKLREFPVIKKSIWVKKWIEETLNSNTKINSKNMELEDYTTEELIKIIENKYRNLLINMLCELAEKSIGSKEITYNTTIGSVIIKINGNE